MSQNIKQKRMMKEIEHLAKNPTDEYKAGPLNNDLYTWHFTLRGPTDTEFEDGIYHGQIIFPFNYPHEPPDIYFLTKSGRFEVNQKICLTITGFHADQWNSSWTARLILEALISMFPEKEQVQSIGSLINTVEARKKLAKDSWNYQCEKCGPISNILKQREKKQPEPEQKISEQTQTIPQEKSENDEHNIQIDLEKQQKSLEEMSQKLKLIQEMSQKPKLGQDENNRHSFNQQQQYFQQSQYKGETDREYSFKYVINNLEEAMNVINSIKFIDPNQEAQADKKQQKANNPQPAQETQVQSQQNEQNKNDTIKIPVQKEEPINLNEKDKINIDEQKEQTNNVQQIQDKEIKQVEEPEESKEQTNEINSQDNKNEYEIPAENKQDSKNDNKFDNQQIEEESKEQNNDDNNIQNKNESQKEENSNNNSNIQNDLIDEDDHFTKEQGKKELKKLDTLIYTVLILFILYLTILFQIKI